MKYKIFLLIFLIGLISSISALSVGTNGTIGLDLISDASTGGGTTNNYYFNNSGNSTQMDTVNGNITIKESWLDSLFTRTSSLGTLVVSFVGNWTLDKIDVYNIFDLLSLNNTNTNSRIDTINSTITDSNASWLSTYNETYNIQIGRMDVINSTITDSNASWLSTYNGTYNAYNSTGLIKDYNSTGLIKDWNSSGFIINWNSTGYIMNWNISGLIKDYNPINTTASLVYGINTTANIQNLLNSTGIYSIPLTINTTANIQTLVNSSYVFRGSSNQTYVSCSNITGGSDADFCADATGVAGSGEPIWVNYSWYLGLNTSYPSFVNISSVLFVNRTSARVGIGTTSPQGKLEIKSASTFSYPFIVRNSANSNILADIYEGGGGNGNLRLYKQDGTQNIVFQTSGDSYINSGNVGIGTTTPVDKLHISGSNDNEFIRVIASNDVSTPTGGGGMIKLGGRRSDGVEGLYGGILGGRENIALNNQGYLAFFSGLDNGSLSTERMRITSSGNVGIGTANPTQPLNVIGAGNFTGALYVQSANVNADGFTDHSGFGASAYTTTLCWDNSGESIIYACSSTREVKDNEQPLNLNASQFLMQLQPKTYNPINIETNETLQQTNIGLIAEDVYDLTKGTLFESLVQFDEKGEPRGIDYSFGLVTLLVKGFQEHNARIEKLEQENIDLKKALCSMNSSLGVCK